MSTALSERDKLLGSTVVYQVYVRSFMDSNGNGVGDLRGITSRLDYLAELGVDYVWITPFFPSPQNDGGYDVSDYRAVDPLFGTMDDFDKLVREADRRGIGLMLDMVFNHTSTEHAWFQRALAGDPTYLAYYKFVDAAEGATAENPGEPPTNWESKFGGSAWEYVPTLNKWYLHLFDVTQADLNWDNPAVREELADVLRFWRGKGVHAFRFDVVNLVSKPAVWANDHEGDGRRFYTDGPHVHEYLRELVRKGGIGDCVTVGEMSSTSIDNCVHYSSPTSHELSMVFSFHHLKVDYPNGEKWQLMDPDIAKLRDVLRAWQEGLTEGGGWNALFWSNHDQPRPNSRFGDDTSREAWLASSKMLALCTHLMRGTPYIYQGEELGMTNPDFTRIEHYRDVETVNYYRILQERGLTPDEAFHVVHERSRDDARTPVQWDASPYAGFSMAEPWIGVNGNHTWLNAAAQIHNRYSVYAFYRRLIRLRKESALIQGGSVRFVHAPSDKVIAYERRLGKTRLLVECNFSGTAQPGLATEGGAVLIGTHPEAGETGWLRPWEGVARVLHD